MKLVFCQLKLPPTFFLLFCSVFIALAWPFFAYMLFPPPRHSILFPGPNDLNWPSTFLFVALDCVCAISFAIAGCILAGHTEEREYGSNKYPREKRCFSLSLISNILLSPSREYVGEIFLFYSLPPLHSSPFPHFSQ